MKRKVPKGKFGVHYTKKIPKITKKELMRMYQLQAKAQVAASPSYSDKELKYIDTYIKDQAGSSATGNDWLMDVNAAGVGVNTLCAPAQGSGNEQRDGRKIVVKSIYVNGFVELDHFNNVAGPDGVMAIICLVWDSKTQAENASATMSTGVFESPIAADAEDSIACLRNMINTDRYRIIWFKRITFPCKTAFWDGATGQYSGFKVPIKKFWRCDIPVTFSGSNAHATSSVVDNSFHILCGRGTQGTVGVNLAIRARFVG